MANKNKENQQSSDNDAKESSAKQSPPPTILSWSIRGLSVLIILSLIGYFAWSAAQPTSRPEFVFNIQEDKIEQRGTGWVLPFTVTNESSMSVHALTVKGALTQVQGKPEESVEVTLLGPGEEVSVTLWFDEDPRSKGVKLSVGSYLLP